jgi:hypothetical protein
MQTGDRVRITKLDTVDIGIIEVGNTGVIAKEYHLNDGKESDVFYVKFDDLECPIDARELNADGTYCMCRYQLDVIGEEE